MQRGSRRKGRNEVRQVGRNFFEPYKEVWILSDRSCEPLKTFKQGNNMCSRDSKGKKRRERVPQSHFQKEVLVSDNKSWFVRNFPGLSMLSQKNYWYFPHWIVNFLVFLISVHIVAKFSKIFVKTLGHEIFSFPSILQMMENNSDENDQGITPCKQHTMLCTGLLSHFHSRI